MIRRPCAYTNEPQGTRYRNEWRGRIARNPQLESLSCKHDKRTLFDAQWVAAHWEEVSTRLATVPADARDGRRKLAHPTTIKRKYDA